MQSNLVRLISLVQNHGFRILEKPLMLDVVCSIDGSLLSPIDVDGCR